MYRIAKLPMDERKIIFQNAAEKMGVNAAIVEKDFWVCLTLDYLFYRSPWKNAFTFKGGTSLSKAYGLIDRFSEDIDLILDWRVLGYDIHEPWEHRSNTQQQKFLKAGNERLFVFLRTKFLPAFHDDMSAILGTKATVFITDDDAGTVHFAYPNAYADNSILREIRLEIGAMAAWTPAQNVSIRPYAADYYPAIFSQPSTLIRTTTPERTFWEKVTILHQEAYRPETSAIPSRYSRHYYDLYCMAHKGILDRALAQNGLLADVAEFKRTFYPRPWAKYELARIGTLKLYPAQHSIDRLRSDYKQMRSMIYGEYPDFEMLMSYIAELENTINSFRQ